MPNNTPFRDVGIVVQRIPFQGNFANVILEYEDGRRSTIRTLGLDDNLCWPEIGTKIVITGIVRNGGYLTKFWERV
jgi:hypothetical protein